MLEKARVQSAPFCCHKGVRRTWFDGITLTQNCSAKRENSICQVRRTLARYGVVGDMHQIVPALTEAFKKKLGK